MNEKCMGKNSNCGSLFTKKQSFPIRFVYNYCNMVIFPSLLLVETGTELIYIECADVSNRYKWNSQERSPIKAKFLCYLCYSLQSKLARTKYSKWFIESDFACDCFCGLQVQVSLSKTPFLLFRFFTVKISFATAIFDSSQKHDENISINQKFYRYFGHLSSTTASAISSI